MKRSHYRAKAIVSHGTIELKINDEFFAIWNVPPATDKEINIDTVNSILQEAYVQGYKAAKRDLSAWIAGSSDT